MTLLVVGTHTLAKLNKMSNGIHCTCYFKTNLTAALLLSKMDKACHLYFAFSRDYFQKHILFHSILTLSVMLSSCKTWIPILGYFRLMLKCSASVREKNNCAAFFSHSAWKHIGHTYIIYILTNVQVMYTSWNSFNVWVFALWDLIKTLTWVEGCCFKTEVWESAKINCCKFVPLEVVEASYFLWTSLDVLALEVQL